jgi:GST-like protein
VPNPAAVERFLGEARRTLGLLEQRLGQAPYLAGDDYSVADIAQFGWLWRRAFAGVDLDATPGWQAERTRRAPRCNARWRR